MRMAPKHKYTRDEMVAAALELVKERGEEDLTAKALATLLGISTQPVFTCFGTMDALRADVTEAAEALFDRYAAEGLAASVPFYGFGMAYIRFARENPELYRMLFLSPGGRNAALRAMEHAQAAVRSSLMHIYRLSVAEADRYFRDVWLAVHGLAALIVTDSCPYTEEQIGHILTGVSVSVFKAIREIPGYTEDAFDRDSIFRRLLGTPAPCSGD